MHQRIIRLASALLAFVTLGCEGILDRIEGRPTSGDAGGGPDEASSGATDDDTNGGTDAAGAVTSTPLGIGVSGGAPTAAPAAPLAVTLETRIFTLVVGGSASATAEFSWQTAGSTTAGVEIQMKSSVTNLDWTPLLQGLPASDVGARYQLPVVRQTMWFRAVATDPVSGATGISNIVRFD